jgi:hypothetical protein
MTPPTPSPTFRVAGVQRRGRYQRFSDMILWIFVAVVVHERPSSPREALGEHENSDWRKYAKERDQDDRNDDVNRRHDFNPVDRKTPGLLR